MFIMLLKLAIESILPNSMLKKSIKLRLLFKAKMTSSSFYCNSLQGDSDYNICINSDMTVSCNCQDYDGSGIIGDLKSQTLDEIFQGNRATFLRKTLAAVKLPLELCVFCQELKMEKKSKVEKLIKEYHLPHKGIMVENTVLCNLRCIGCQREKIEKTRKNHKMSLGDIEIVSKTIRDCCIKNIMFFNLGEPFLSNSILDEINIIRRYNPEVFIYTSTNGIFIDNDLKRSAALKINHIFFSIDGINQEQIGKYQVGGNFDVAYKNMKELVALRDNTNCENEIIEWKYVLFNWNDSPEYIDRALVLAKEANVDIISFWIGGGSPQQRTLRYWYHPYYKVLGKKTWKGREVDLRGAGGPLYD